MFYVEAGAGDPLVLVMGFGGDHLAWGLQIPAFAAKYRVVAFDNRGVGQSDAPDAPYTTPMMADATVGLMDALGIARAHVCGVSVGGLIARQNAPAAPYPQSLAGFVHQGEAVRAHDTLERLRDIRCPTLVTVADHDILVPPRFSHAIAQRVPGAELKTLADAGHAYMWERPEA